MFPAYDLDKIKFATDAPTYEKAVGLYESGKVTHISVGYRVNFSQVAQFRIWAAEN